MSDQEAPEQKIALTVIGLLVAIVVAAVLGLGISKARHQPSATAATTTAASAETGGIERIYFALGQDALPPEAADVLARVAKAARANTATVVSVSGFHDASGDLATNQELAKRRAQQVRHALEANGVSGPQIVLNKPAQTKGDGDPAEARRVDIRVE